MQVEASSAIEHGPLQIANTALANKERITAAIMQQIGAYAGRRKRYISSDISENNFLEHIPLKSFGYIDSARLKEKLNLEIQYSLAILSSWNYDHFDNLFTHLHLFVTYFEEKVTEINSLLEDITGTWHEHEEISNEVTNSLIKSNISCETKHSTNSIEINNMLEKLGKARQHPKNFWWYKYVNICMPIKGDYYEYRRYLSRYTKQHSNVDKDDELFDCASSGDANHDFAIDDINTYSQGLSLSLSCQNVCSFDSSKEGAKTTIKRFKDSTGLTAASNSIESETISDQNPTAQRSFTWSKVLRIFRNVQKKMEEKGHQPAYNEAVEAKVIQKCFRGYYQRKTLRTEEDLLKAKIQFSVCGIQALTRRMLVSQNTSRLLHRTFDLIVDAELKIPYYYNLNNGHASWDMPQLLSRYNVELEPSTKGMYKNKLVMANIRPSIDLL